MSLDWVREQAWRQAGDDGWVREVFTDRVILERDNGALHERSWSVDGDDLVLGDPVDVSLEYVAKAEGGPRLAGPILRKDEARRLVYGAVLVPGEPDSDGEVLTAEKIEDAAHTYLEFFQAIDQDHDVERIDASPVESYVEPADREVELGDDTVTLPAGTWTMAVKVHDDEAWKRIVGGEATGFSIMGVPAKDYEAALDAVKERGTQACKRTTLADVGGGDPNGPWIVPFVSMVDEPAVPKAKFYAIKRAVKEGRRFSKATLDQLQQMKATIDGLLATVQETDETESGEAGKEKEMDEATVTALIDEAVPAAVGKAIDDKLTPLQEAVDKLAAKDGGEDEGGDGAPAPEGDDSDEKIPEAVKSKLDEMAAKLEKMADRTRATSRQPDDTGTDSSAHKSLAADYDVYGRRRKG